MGTTSNRNFKPGNSHKTDRSRGLQDNLETPLPRESWSEGQANQSRSFTHDHLLISLPPKVPRGVTMLSNSDVYKRRKKGRSAHYVDIQSGLFIEPVAIGARSRATPDYEVDILIAADIAGKSDEEKRALVRKLRAARKGVL
jgi:prophage regulatory protein